MDILRDKKVLIFELDDVLIPKKDYDLQVYYLFAHFIEYLESFPPANDVIEFMNKRYVLFGEENMFEEVAKTFGINSKYKENLALLFESAKLPLKLLLFKEALSILQDLVLDRKQIIILTAGNPKQQLNKITQTEWNGMDQYLKVYFEDEFEIGKALETIIFEYSLPKNEILFIGKNEFHRVKAIESGFEYINLDQITI